MRNKKSLSDITLLIKRGVTPKYVDSDGHIVLNQKCVRNNFIGYEPSRLSDKNKKVPIEKFLVEGDILVNSTGTGTLGRTARFKELDLPVIPDGHLTIVRPNKEQVVPEYLGYYMSNIEPVIVNMARGATNQVELSATDLGALTVPLPPLPTQKRIADILSAYDDLIENNNRRIALLEQSARHLYKEWFVRFKFPGHEKVKVVDGVPEGWERKTAYDIMDVLSGGTPKTGNPEFWDGDIPFFTPKDATNTPYVLNTEKHITDIGLQKCNSKLYPKDTVFITARGTVGKLNLSQRPMAMNQSCYALVGKNYLSQKYLYCALSSAIEEFKSKASGAVFNAIIVDTFKLIPFLVPPKSLISLFDEFVINNFENIDNLLIQNINLKKARDILLPKLLSGDLGV